MFKKGTLMVKDKIVIITGAAGGIGSATARLLGREGAVLSFIGEALKPEEVAAAVGELLVATGIILFWIAFYAFGLVDIPDPRLREIYLAFESAFPFADICLALVLIRGGIGLLRRASYGTLFSVLGGAALVFLGLLDISFNSRHGIYRLGYEEALINGAINVLCLGFGLFLVKTAWKNRIEARNFARAS